MRGRTDRLRGAIRFGSGVPTRPRQVDRLKLTASSQVRFLPKAGVKDFQSFLEPLWRSDLIRQTILCRCRISQPASFVIVGLERVEKAGHCFAHPLTVSG